MSRTITDLRESLFDTIDALKDGKMSVENAKAVAELAQTIVNTAKVEVDFISKTHAADSGFISSNKAVGQKKETEASLPSGAIVRSVVHKVVG